MNKEINAPYKLFNKLFAEEYSFYVHVNPMEDTKLPVHLQNKNYVMLQIGANLPVPITDLFVDEKGFSCVLSFSGSPFHVFVSWEAVYGLSCGNGKGYIFKPLPQGLYTASREPQQEQKKAVDTSEKVVSLADYKKKKGIS